MSSSIPLAIVLIVALLASFFFVHALLRNVPYTETSPRETHRWPVWNWYPLVVISALVLTLSANVFFTRRAERLSPSGGPDIVEMKRNLPDDYSFDRQLVAGKEAPKIATKSTGGTMTTTSSGKKSR